MLNAIEQIYPTYQIDTIFIANLDSNLFLINVAAFDSANINDFESETISSGMLTDSIPYFTFSLFGEGSEVQTEYGKGLGVIHYLNQYNYFMLDPDGNAMTYDSTLIYYSKGSDISGTPYYLVDGINNISSTPNINLYPNPTTDQLHLSISAAEQLNTQFIITDILGQEVYSSPVTQSETTHDISKLSAGIYTWRVVSPPKQVR